MLKLSVDNWDTLLTMLQQLTMLTLVKELDLYNWMMCHVLVLNLLCLTANISLATTPITLKILVLDVVVSLVHTILL